MDKPDQVFVFRLSKYTFFTPLKKQSTNRFDTAFSEVIPIYVNPSTWYVSPQTIFSFFTSPRPSPLEMGEVGNKEQPAQIKN